jgi:hypothetical protein
VARPLRLAIAVTGLAAAVVAVGFVLEWSWAIDLWPFPDAGRYSYLFIGSIAAAMGAAALWVAVIDDLAVLTPGLLNVAVMFGGQAVYLATADEGATAAVLGVLALGNAAAWWRTRHLVPHDTALMPAFVRVAFGIFVAVLAVAGLALVFDVADIFPWPLRHDEAVMFGWIFVGDACFFAYGLARPYRAYAIPQLWAFLAYDLVLIGPFVALFDGVQDGHELRLVLYTIVLLFSAGVAIGYLTREGTVVSRSP